MDENMSENGLSLAVIGGTGNLGWALAFRWVQAGYDVAIGSRSAERAAEAAARIKPSKASSPVQGMTNEDATANADVIIVAVPFASQEPILRSIADAAKGKLIVDTTVPLVPPKVARVQMPAAGCAALAARNILGDDARLTSAFHNVAAHKLKDDVEIDCDVLVFGDDPGDREIVVGLAAGAGLRGIHGGPLANSVAAEAFTSILIGINKRYKADGAGIRITGLTGL
jgi:NADPH-dependent F420 reductase